VVALDLEPVVEWQTADIGMLSGIICQSRQEVVRPTSPRITVRRPPAYVIRRSRIDIRRASRAISPDGEHGFVAAK